MITMHKVLNSSQVFEFGYDPDTKRLTVIFTSGGYDYIDVPQNVFDEMVKQNNVGLSMGKLIANHIKTHFKFEKHPIAPITPKAKCGNVLTGSPCENATKEQCDGCLACPDTGQPAPCDKLPCCQGVKGCDEN
jgi:hypothetical protein